MPVSPTISRSARVAELGDGAAQLLHPRRRADQDPFDALAVLELRRSSWTSKVSRRFEGALDDAGQVVGGERLLDEIQAPAFIAWTAMATSPWPVIRITGSAGSMREA